MLHDFAIKGFSTTQAEKLLEQYGLNELDEAPEKNILLVFFEQFNNFLTILLIIAAALSFFVHAAVDGTLILSIVILNALFGIYQEKKASDAISALKNMSISRVRVIRDKREVEIDSRYLVPGDIIFLEEGSKVPADATILQSINLETNEAALTGESLPIGKKNDDDIFMGTIISRGRGYAEVQETGMKTRFGQIAAKLSSVEETKTPLQKKLEGLTKFIGVVGILISVIVFALSLFDGAGYFPSFLLAISLAVAVVPEGLPAVMTITLSIGVKEMARQKAIVRKLSAIEALGNVSLIATDKTGTLTANKMKVKELYVDNFIYNESKLPNVLDSTFARMLLNGILCSTASLVYSHSANKFDVLGDPTEGAILFLAQKAGLMPEAIREKWQVIDEIPFDSVSKMMTAVVKHEDELFTFTKGALESILTICDSIYINGKKRPINAEKLEEIQRLADEWAGKGLRILAFSFKQGFGTGKDKLYKQSLLGMVAIHDPPRLEVKDALKKAQTAGIQVVMITGDNERTAEAVGTAIGLVKNGDDILTGKQIDTYSDEELLQILPKVRIFARTTPFHKARIVKLYQEIGHIVAVTGDGVNDAIALKQADIGVAMGLVGTDVARETADMIILDDNFATIVKAIEEGRNIIKNLKNAIKYLLACNLSEAIALITGLLLGLPTLFYAIQLLYINLITDGIPALALAFSPREEKSMEQKPSAKLELLNNFDHAYILLIGFVGSVMVISAFYLFNDTSEILGKTGVFSVLALIQSFIFIDLWLSHRTILKNLKKLLSGMFFIAFIIPLVTQYIIVTVPLVAQVFKTTVVPIQTYTIFVAFSAAILIFVGLIKRMLKKRIRLFEGIHLQRLRLNKGRAVKSAVKS